MRAIANLMCFIEPPMVRRIYIEYLFAFYKTFDFRDFPAAPALERRSGA
jgi:hypothetical protein